MTSAPIGARSPTASTQALGHSPRRRAVVRSLAGVDVVEFRPDVEGLRALAVIAVVLFHARLSAFSGGFIGVDVFFVLSGFLITRLLVRELASSGKLSLPAFWARRARRLLPASGLAIIVTLLAARVLLPPVGFRPLGVDALAAGLFAVNFVFAHRLGDYFGSQLGQTMPSPLLHFWSLAVEEQFYLFWPATMLLLTRRPRRYRRLVVLVILLVGTASFVASVWLTDHHPTWAFYLLPARIGELLAGALLAMAGSGYASVSARGRAAAAWLGVLGIAVAVVLYDGTTVFPGAATIMPVICTVLIVIGGGAGAWRYSPSTALSVPPMQWIGRHSYAIYLWHWPALVLAEAKWGPLSLPQRGLAIAVSVMMAAASLRLVEDPVRRSPWAAARPTRGLLIGAALCLTVVAAGWVTMRTTPRLDSGTVAAAPVLSITSTQPVGTPISTSGTPDPNQPSTTVVDTQTGLPAGDLASLVAANRVVLEQGLATVGVPSNLRPSLAKVYNDRPKVYPDGCVAIGVDDQLNACRYGVRGASTEIVLFGDSHAAQWFPALEQIAVSHGFELVVLAKGGCPTAAVNIPTATLQRTCPIWRDKAIGFIQSERPDLVIVTASAHYPNTDAEWSDGFDATMGRLAPLATHVLVLGDNPGAKEEPAGCLSSHINSVQSCSNSRRKAVETSRIAVEQAVAAKHGATFIDTSDWFCTDTECPTIIGDIMIFRDVNHITTVAAVWFRPLLEAAITPILSS
jgi:peptidoglycan/LPS O-acetylase OafA/YrhL